MVTTEVIIPSMSLCPFVHHYWIMKTCWNEHVIGFSRGIPFNHTEACATFWNEYIERMVKPVYMEGMNLYPIHSGQWLKVYFEGGLRAFQEEFARFIRQWLPLHPAYKWADNASCLEWYKGTDVNSPDYPCGILMPIKK